MRSQSSSVETYYVFLTTKSPFFSLLKRHIQGLTQMSCIAITLPFLFSVRQNIQCATEKFFCKKLIHVQGYYAPLPPKKEKKFKYCFILFVNGIKKNLCYSQYLKFLCSRLYDGSVVFISVSYTHQRSSYNIQVYKTWYIIPK